VNNTAVVDVREAPVVVERVEKAAVVHEVLKTEEVVQIQPVIEREREKLDVYEVVQPMREREVIATEVRQAVLPAQTRATVVEDNSAFLAQRSAPTDFSTREVAQTLTQTVQNAPIIHETIVHRVIEEVQPVIYKEIDRPILVKETQPIYEKIVEAPHAHHSVLPVRDLGVRTTTTGFTDLNRDGIPDQLQGGIHTTGLTSGLQGQFQQSTLSQDLNRNGIPDSLERQGSYGLTQGSLPLSQDLNRNGIPDSLERQGFAQGSTLPLSQDLNRNGIPDSLERRQGSALPVGQDLNRNGIPDSLERQGLNQGYQQPSGLLSQPQIVHTGLPQGGMQSHNAPRTLSDLNGNGIPDRMEKAHGLNDLNGNGVDDSLERRMGSTSLNSTRL